jgi:hypothetical protein
VARGPALTQRVFALGNDSLRLVAVVHRSMLGARNGPVSDIRRGEFDTPEQSLSAAIVLSQAFKHSSLNRVLRFGLEHAQSKIKGVHQSLFVVHQENLR